MEKKLTPQIVEIRVLPEQASKSEVLEKQLCKKLRWERIQKSQYRILKKSLDARKNPIIFRFRIEVFANGFEEENVTKFPTLGDQSAVIVGFGPAGMFAALELLKNGVKPIVIERGKEVSKRRRDLVRIFRDREVNPDSNYCFGEGGAGTFSDGKLYTRSKKRGDIQDVLQTFVDHGAKPEIVYEAHPHIGTNKLPGIVQNIRESIIKLGGEVRFDTKLTDIILENGKICGVETSNGLIPTNHIILATGHSARDIFELLHTLDIAIEAKPFALGVRIEHPQDMIDRAQYKCERGEFLPPASYSLVKQVKGRGVFSFCMCPGGIIAPTMTDSNEVVVNGWSPSKRNGEFSNSGFVVEIGPNDWKRYGENNPLAAMKFQEKVEGKAFRMGGEDLTAPAQRVGDFLKGKPSPVIQETSYLPGVKSVDLNEVLPGFVHQRIRGAIAAFGKRLKGYDSNAGVLVGVESRTSSPVRIPRDRESLEHPDVHGLYPCGEGAGYAGGIMSAALDGIACARKIGESISAK